MLRSAAWSFAAALALLPACAAVAPKPEAAQAACATPIELAQGAFRGGADGEVCAWKGVPFAQSGPAYRFRKPGPAPKHDGVQAAETFGQACRAAVLESLAPAGVAEDCLNHNLWRPAGAPPPGGWPIMVFLHGGAFFLGAGSWDVYDGANLAKNGVAVVTLNYRLGPLGFYGSAAQRAADPDGAVGNWGIWDQIAALAWLRDNAAAFGANPGNVTVFGESAGAFSVCTLLAAPPAAGLFHRAIMQSGGCLVNSLEEQLAFGKRIAEAAGCGDPAREAECMRALAADDLNFRVPMWNGNAPTVDGVLLREQPVEALRAGRAHAVPLLIGANREEQRPLTMVPSVAWSLTRSRERFYEDVEAGWGDAAVLRRLYASAGGSTRQLWTRMIDDIFFLCGAVGAAEAHAAHAPVYAYEFDIGERRSWADRQLGAYHSAELPLVFGFLAWNRVMGDGYLAEARAAAYSREIQAYWTSFAKHGDPNTRGQELWPAYGGGHTVVRLQPGENEVLARHARDRCAYWSANGGDTFAKQVNLQRRFSLAAGVSTEFLHAWE